MVSDGAAVPPGRRAVGTKLGLSPAGGGGSAGYVQPPSTTKVWLVHMPAVVGRQPQHHAGPVGRIQPAPSGIAPFSVACSASCVTHSASWRSVMIQPGSTQLTRMRCAPEVAGEAAGQRLDPGLARGVGGHPAHARAASWMQPKLTIEPRARRDHAGATAWIAKNWCRRFTAMRSSQYSGVTSCQRGARHGRRC